MLWELIGQIKILQRMGYGFVVWVAIQAMVWYQEHGRRMLALVTGTTLFLSAHL